MEFGYDLGEMKYFNLARHYACPCVLCFVVFYHANTFQEPCHVDHLKRPMLVLKYCLEITYRITDLILLVRNPGNDSLSHE